MKKLWFKAKRYGWGWYPVTWQGWLSMAVYIGLIYALALRIQPGEAGKAYVLYIYLPIVFAATVGLIYLAYKTGEKARWRWGEDKPTK